MSSAPAVPESMLLVLPVPFRLIDGQLYVESQAANGLDRWADHFAQLTVAAPVIPEEQAASLPGVAWLPLSGCEHIARIEAVALPWAYTPGAFLRELSAVRQRLAGLIRRSQYLQFAIGGLAGDWAAIAALEAATQGRRFAIHTDRVEHEVIRKTAASGSTLRRLKIAVEAPLMERYHRHIIRLCSLGLWHGEDCFRAYSPWCRENHLIHDIHTRQADLISEAQLAAKLADVRSSTVLRVCYAGRLDPMKAPLEWLQAVAAAREAGAEVEAVWYGDGAMLDEALAERVRLKLDEVVRYPGFVAGRAALLDAVREAHVLVFTHVTPESPRNLIEALVCGTPMVGYASAYAANLLEGFGGGVLVPVHDFAALGLVVAELAGDRERLVGLTEAAARNGRRFTDAAVFAERSELVKGFA